jgi:hypothetical protein
MKTELVIKVGDIVELRNSKVLKADYQGARLKVKKLNSAGKYHSGVQQYPNGGRASFATLFHPNDVKAVNP